MTAFPEGSGELGDDLHLLGFEEPAAEVDPTLDQIDQGESTFEEWWGETLEAVQPWGPRIATAYRDARQAAGNKTITREYTEEGPVALEPAQERAEQLQPDVLIVDIVRKGRSLRSPIKDTIDEHVSTGGWTISRREFPAPEEEDVAEEAAPDAAKPKAGKTDLLDELDADDIEDETPQAAAPEAKKNMLVERVVLMQDGKLVRMVGKNDGRPNSSTPLRFARVRPDKELKTEDEAEFTRQKELLEQYKKDNAEHFVQPGDLDIVALLNPDTIAEADLGQLPADAPEDATSYELDATMVSGGLARFLGRRGLADEQQIAELRAL